jgi:hypothetical protein
MSLAVTSDTTQCIRYHAIDDGGDVRIKIVIGEYLACEVLWAR